MAAPLLTDDELMQNDIMKIFKFSAVYRAEDKSYCKIEVSIILK